MAYSKAGCRELLYCLHIILGLYTDQLLQCIQVELFVVIEPFCQWIDP